MLWEPGITRLPNNNFFSFSFFLFWPPPCPPPLKRTHAIKARKEMPGSLTSKSKALLGGISLGFHTMPRFSSSSSVHCARELRESERETERACVAARYCSNKGRKKGNKEGRKGVFFFRHLWPRSFSARNGVTKTRKCPAPIIIVLVLVCELWNQELHFPLNNEDVS